MKINSLTVARIGNAAYAMIPTADGRHYLGSGWRLTKPLSDWKQSDFYGLGGDVADEAAFHAVVQEQAEHQGEKVALRREEFRAPANTPWGPSQGAVRYAEGLVFHSTSGHGGFHLSADRNARVHPLMRDAGGYYEEDAAWAAGVDKTWGSCRAFSVCDGQPTIENCGPCDGYSVSPFGRPPHPSALSHAGICNVID